ncbi:PAN domain [Phytophthora infestans]|uniref:PAN domain n=1 Tax=Phytophthora infestans TaxID=4787 RepID=A0A833WD60_PHYIN|nr:PAN domain [Phytophthora infestans]KAF4134910.1 PAN domain [Phytophthora infestans]
MAALHFLDTGQAISKLSAMKRSLLAGLALGFLLNADGTTGTESAGDTEIATAIGSTCGTQLKNIFYHGFNLQTSTVSNAAACCDLCASYNGCVLYTYFQSSSTGQSLCYLKSGAGENTNYADSSSATAVSVFMVSATGTPTPTTTNAPSPTTATPSACYEQLDGVFYNDNTIFELSTDSADECCRYCSQLASEGCVLYTLYVSKSENVKRCLLKSAAGTATNYTNSDDLTIVSAFLPASATPSPTPTGECTAEGQYCGNAQGTTCSESHSYCQPWNSHYYQCIGLPDGCGNLETDID